MTVKEFIHKVGNSISADKSVIYVESDTPNSCFKQVTFNEVTEEIFNLPVIDVDLYTDYDTCEIYCTIWTV